MNYLLQFFISFLMSIFAVWLAKIFGIKFKLFDLPKEDAQKIKIHQKPIPFFGGLAMLLVFLTVYSVGAYLQNSFNWQFFTILFSTTLVFFIGFFDDLKWKNHSVRPLVKLLFLVIFSSLAAFLLISGEVRINFFSHIILGYFLTFFYILALINVVDFQDGLDGLAGGMVAISLIGFTILSLVEGNLTALVISVIVLGALLGFLVFNFNPASIFMGDSGAYFLGGILAILAMLFSKHHDFLSIIGPMLIIGVPIFDTANVLIKRFFSGKSLIVGDRDHFYDILHFKKGVAMGKTLLICYILQIAVVAGGIILMI